MLCCAIPISWKTGPLKWERKWWVLDYVESNPVPSYSRRGSSSIPPNRPHWVGPPSCRLRWHRCRRSRRSGVSPVATGRPKWTRGDLDHVTSKMELWFSYASNERWHTLFGDFHTKRSRGVGFVRVAFYWHVPVRFEWPVHSTVVLIPLQNQE